MSLDTYFMSLLTVPPDRIYRFSVALPLQCSQAQPTSGSNVDKDFLTITELSEYLGVKRSTVYAWVRDGQIPYYRVNKKLIRFKRDEIDRWMKDQMKDNKKEEVNVDKQTNGIQNTVNRRVTDINSVVQKAIAKVKGNLYTPKNGRSDRVKDLGKEVSDGVI